MEPFPKGSRFGHLSLIEVGFTGCKDIQVHLGNKRPEFCDLRVLKWRGKEASNDTESQLDMARGFGLGERITKSGVC